MKPRTNEALIHEARLYKQESDARIELLTERGVNVVKCVFCELPSLTRECGKCGRDNNE